MDSTPPSKDTVWQTGLKRNIQQLVGLTKINTGLGLNLEEDLPSQWP
jgi:hypothetical protein